jgi:hypothetical protein
MRATPPPLSSILLLTFTLTLSIAALPGHATTTQTVLTVSPSAPVERGTTITLTLTAHVTASGVAVHPGTVTFCNANAAHCEDPAILGTAQLTPTAPQSSTSVSQKPSRRYFAR